MRSLSGEEWCKKERRDLQQNIVVDPPVSLIPYSKIVSVGALERNQKLNR
jgi:hypothetical protein